MTTASPEPAGFAKDSWFNPGLTPATDRLREVVAYVENVLEHHYKRAPKPQERQTLHRVLTALIANLAQHYFTSSPGGVVVPRSKKVLGSKATRYEPFVFPKPFPKWLDVLEALRFITQRKGAHSNFPGRSRRSAVRAGTKLLALMGDHHVTLRDIRDDGTAEVIILSRSKRGYWDDDTNARVVDYEDTTTTRRFRSELQEINAWLGSADIQFDATAYFWYADALKLRQRHVDVSQRKLRRRFTLQSFDNGGRLFGGFWEPLSKQARLRFTRIQGEAVTGLDYSQLNPLLCYSIADAKPPTGDAYTLPGLEEYRDSVKRVFNAMLFHHPVTRFPKRSKDEIEEGSRLFPEGIKCGGVVAMILHYHPKLKGVLSSGNIGHHLQFLESQIMMRVLLRCRERNIVALPVFDCVVVRASAAAAAKEIMQQEFKAVTKLNIEVKRETPEFASDSEQTGVRRSLLELLQKRVDHLRPPDDCSGL